MKKGLLSKLFAGILVLALIISSMPAGAARAEELKTSDIAAVLSGTSGEKYQVKGAVTMVDGKNVYMQDSTGAIALYLSEAATDVALGDTIIAQGALSEYNGVIQLSSASYTKSSGMKLNVKETTIGSLSAKDISSYVKLVGLEITKIDDGDGKYSTPNLFCTDGREEIEIYKAVVKKTESGWEYKVGDKLTVTGAYTVYKDTKELRNTLTTEIRLYDPERDSILAAGNEVLIYNADAKGVIGEADTKTLKTAEASVDGVYVSAANGARVFTIKKNGEFYRFYNTTDGYLCANGTGSNAFYSKTASVDADWRVIEADGCYFLENQSAKYKETPQYLEYYSGAVTTYSKKDTAAFKFELYKTNDNVTAGIVNKPEVKIGKLADANIGSEYKFSFSVNAYFGIKSLTAKVGKTEIRVDGEDGTYSAVIPAELVKGSKVTVKVTGKDAKNVAFAGSATVKVVDEPFFANPAPASKSETGSNKKPVISVEVSNAGRKPVVEMTVAGKSVKAAYSDGVISYKPDKALADGYTNVIVKVTRQDKASATYSWSFTVGEATEKLYFGQLHSHTAEYSDGAGTLAEGLEYIGSLPESANVQFVAFTDHSNYFDTTAEANPEAALYDMSLASEYSNNQWDAYRKAVADFNASQSNVVALAGFEMTWSGGPGHINTFNTPGIVSRNNSVLNNKTADAGMKAYYSLLSKADGAASISQLNHPGATFGTFADFSYWDPIIDTRVYLVEVGNGEGQIGAGGYYPSYEYYTMALDKGWHVAPTNNQDNHKGKWGNANDARDVILTSDFSEEGIYDAIRARRVYATEDKNLELYFYVNDLPLGSIIDEVPEKLNITARFRDPDATDSISKVELVVNSGKTVYTVDDPAALAAGEFKITLDPDYSYYYLRVTEGDGDIAVTAPVWVGETLKLGISSIECGTSTPVTNEELSIKTTLFNSESSAATVKSVVYTTNGSEVIGTDKTGYTIPSLGTADIEFRYVPKAAKVMKVTATVVIEQKGIEYTYSMDVELDVLDADSLLYIGIDASHYNEYVAGNYKDSMGNFGELCAGYSVRTNELHTGKELIEACSNDKYKAIILTAPSRRLAEAQANPGVYSKDELKALKSFAQKGGTLILAGWSDNYENYAEITSNASISHMADTQNTILETIGSHLRINDDATNDDSLNGGQSQRLYFSTYNFDSFLLDRVELDAEHPNDVMYTERYSQYGGASICVVDKDGKATDRIPSNITPIVYGHATTYVKDSDGDGFGPGEIDGTTVKYPVADGDNRILVLASEELTWKDGTTSLVIVAGAAFMSNFEVQYSVGDSGSEKNYSNYKMCENLAAFINPLTITPISEVQAQKEAGIKYTIEGVVTSNASGYDKDTAFFDCIYVQDETAGICCFPVAGDYRIGDVVRITGTTDFYQGEAELQVTSIEKIGTGKVPAPKAVSAKDINSGKVLGSLVSLTGTVESFEKQNGLIQTIMVKDSDGKLARVFIDGYICKNSDISGLKKGAKITVVGLASYDDTFGSDKAYFARIRVRNRADILAAGASVSNDGRYVVKAGDTLKAIAKALLGRESRFWDIYNANKDIIADPDLIYIGQKLIIP